MTSQLLEKNNLSFFNKNNMIQLGFIVLTTFLVFFVFANPAMADGGGFADEATNKLKDIRTALVTIISVVAGIALVWQMAEGFMGAKTWTECFKTMAWIFGAGAAVAIATWVFTTGQSVSF